MSAAQCNPTFLFPGVHLKRLAGRRCGGCGCDQPRSQNGGPRHQSLPGGERHERLPQRTPIGEDGPEGPGTGAASLTSNDAPRPKFTLPSHCFCFLLSKDTSELFFEDVRLPAEALLGEANKGFYYLMNELPQVKGHTQPCMTREAQGGQILWCLLILR